LPHTPVSIVIPAYDEGERLPVFLRAVVGRALATARPRLELIVVDDGSATEHARAHGAAVAEAAETLRQAGSPHRVRLVTQSRNQGKGAAIRRGWAEADPEAGWLGFVDADGSVCAVELIRLVDMLRPDARFDALCGARVRTAGRRVRRSLFRHLQGRMFALLVEGVFGLGLSDTQCGVKFARAERLRPLLATLREGGWLLDVEMLAALHRAGASLAEEAIDWADTGSSHVRFGVDAARMAWGLRALKRHLASAEPRLADEDGGRWRDVA